MSDKLTRVYLGDVPLIDTQDSCLKIQKDQTANLFGLRPARYKNTDGTFTKVNVADFEKDKDRNPRNIYADLRLVDVSTNTGKSLATELEKTYELRFSCQAYINNAIKNVKVLGKKEP